MDTHKRCSRCKVKKEVSEFYKDKSRKDGMQHRCKECLKDYYQANRKALIEKSRRHYRDNKEYAIKRQVEYTRNRRATDPTAALIHRHRARVNSALDGVGKAESSIELLGCTPAQYRHHIEAQFVEGMAWNQRGLWHIDHYHPIAAFDMTLKKHQKYGFHWSNCSPMWAEDNLRKKDNHCPDELSTYLNSKLPKYKDVYPV